MRVRIDPAKKRKAECTCAHASCEHGPNGCDFCPCHFKRGLTPVPESMHVESGGNCPTCGVNFDEVERGLTRKHLDGRCVKRTKNERKAQRTVDNLQHVQRLADALAPDAREYEYKGGCYDAGKGAFEKCACGHPIRYVFPVEHKDGTRTVNIGSVCIRTSVPWLMANGNEALARALEGALDKLLAEIKERERKEREKRNELLVKAAWKEWDALKGWVAYQVERGPYMLKSSLRYAMRKAPKDGSTHGRTLANITRRFTSEWADIVRTLTSPSFMPLDPNATWADPPTPPLAKAEILKFIAYRRGSSAQTLMACRHVLESPSDGTHFGQYRLESARSSAETAQRTMNTLDRLARVVNGGELPPPDAV